MPPVREINFDDGIYIKLSNGEVFHDSAASMQARLAGTPGNLVKKEAAYNNWIQSQEPFIHMHAVADYPDDHQVKIDTANLPPWRIMAGAFVGEVMLWVAVHFFDDNPLSFTVRCQDRNIPITGEWW